MSWIIRLKEEMKTAKNAVFITLTYNDKNIPTDEHGNTYVSKEDCQKFLKRLRKRSNAKNLKYYLASEYGPVTFRPHYHAILFNLPDDDIMNIRKLIALSWTIKDKTTKQLNSLGFVQVDKVNENRIAYVTGYVMDKFKNPKSDYIVFSLMSKGLGKSYLEKEERVKWHYEKPLENMYYPLENGKKLALPRYYRNKIIKSEISRNVLQGISEKEAFLDWCKNHEEITENFTKTVQKIQAQEKRYNKNKKLRKL